jgi:outer membrane protein
MRHRFIIGMVLLAMAAAGTARADVRLAFVDIQRAINECRAGKQAKSTFRAHIDQLQAQLEGEQHSVEALKQQLEQKGALMQPDQRQNLEDDYNKKLRRFQDDVKNSRDELQQRDTEVTGAIVRDLAAVVRRVSEKNGYTMVMEKGTLLWAEPSTDITDEVIRQYDAMNVKPGSLGDEVSGGRFGKSGGRPTAPSIAAPAAPAAPEPAEPPPASDNGRSTISK